MSSPEQTSETIKKTQKIKNGTKLLETNKNHQRRTPQQQFQYQPKQCTVNIHIKNF